MENKMIYTVTFNPSLDYVVQVEHFPRNMSIREAKGITLR